MKGNIVRIWTVDDESSYLVLECCVDDLSVVFFPVFNSWELSVTESNFLLGRREAVREVEISSDLAFAACNLVRARGHMAERMHEARALLRQCQ